MARRNRYGYTAPKTAPKPIKVVKPTVDPDGLKQAYEWLAVDRNAGFKLAFDWYGTNLTALLFGDPLDADRQKSYDRALKSKAQGDHTTFDGERQTAWTTALRFYEKVWASRDLPKVADALAAVDIGTTPSRRVSDVQTVIGMLNSAYDGLVTFRMTFGSEREADGNEVLLPVADIAAMVPLTPLKSALRELPTVAKLLSIVTDTETGEQSLDGGKFMSTLPTLLDKVADWGAHGNLASKAVGKAPAVRTKRAASTSQKAPRTPGAARSKTNTAQVINFVPNVIRPSLRGIRSKIADLLRTCGGNTVAQFQAAVATSIPGKHTWDAKTVLEAYVAAGAVTLT